MSRRSQQTKNEPVLLDLIHANEVEVNDFFLFHFNKNVRDYGSMDPHFPSKIYQRKQKVFSALANTPSQAVASFLAFEEKKFKSESHYTPLQVSLLLKLVEGGLLNLE